MKWLRNFELFKEAKTYSNKNFNFIKNELLETFDCLNNNGHYMYSEQEDAELVQKVIKMKKIADNFSYDIILEPVVTEKSTNLSSLNNLSRGNSEFVQKMITIFIAQTTETIEKVEDAIEVKNYLEVSRLIHKIKPSIEGIGIISILEEVKLLEKISAENNNKKLINSLFNTIKFTLEKVILQLKENELT